MSFALKIVRNSTAKHERIYLEEEDKEEDKEEKPKRTLTFLGEIKGESRVVSFFSFFSFSFSFSSRGRREDDGVFIECNSGEES